MRRIVLAGLAIGAMLAACFANAASLAVTLEIKSDGTFPVQVTRPELEKTLTTVIADAGHTISESSRRQLGVRLMAVGDGERLALGLTGIAIDQSSGAGITCVLPATVLLDHPDRNQVREALATYAARLANRLDECYLN